MRLWAHLIWHDRNGSVLQTAGPKENERFESMLHEWGEEKIAYAWYLYVNAEPCPYNLEPVKHVDEFTSKKGNRIVREVENTAAITRFPLSAFLAVSEGYIIKASVELDKVLAVPKEKRVISSEIFYVLDKIRTKTPSIKSAW